VIKARRLRWAEQACKGERRGAHRVWWENLRERDHFGRQPKREDNIKMDIKNVGFGDMDWMNLAHVRDRCLAFVNAAKSLRVPPSAGNF
jgi:hypothetical protein